MYRLLLSTAAFALVLCLHGSAASAQTSDVRLFSGADAALVVGVGVIGVSIVGGVLALGIADLASYGEGHPFDDGWASVDVITGIVCLVPGLILMALGASQEAAGGSSGALIPSGLVVGAWGLHLVSHGVWSFLENGRPRTALAPSLSASNEHIVVSVAGTFG